MRHMRVPGRADVALAELIALCGIEAGGHCEAPSVSRRVL